MTTVILQEGAPISFLNLKSLEYKMVGKLKFVWYVWYFKNKGSFAFVAEAGLALYSKLPSNLWQSCFCLQSGGIQACVTRTS